MSYYFSCITNIPKYLYNSIFGTSDSRSSSFAYFRLSTSSIGQSVHSIHDLLNFFSSPTNPTPSNSTSKPISHYFDSALEGFGSMIERISSLFISRTESR